MHQSCRVLHGTWSAGSKRFNKALICSRQTVCTKAKAHTYTEEDRGNQCITDRGKSPNCNHTVHNDMYVHTRLLVLLDIIKHFSYHTNFPFPKTYFLLASHCSCHYGNSEEQLMNSRLIDGNDISEQLKQLERMPKSRSGRQKGLIVCFWKNKNNKAQITETHTVANHN